MHEERQVIFNKGKISTYKGMSNLYCDYVTIVMGNTKETYYKLNNKKLDNNFWIASPVLKEAIDPDIPKTSLGLINKQGDVIIPFENRDIRVIDDKYLLVIRNVAKTSSVLSAIESRNDPNAATRMVDTDNNIKDRMNKATNNSGKYLLNDRFSEGTLYTVDGRNILGNKYYSFICMSDDSFYCSINVANSPIVEVPRNAPFSVMDSAPVVEPISPEVPLETTPAKDNFTPKLDVSNVNVSKKDIDSALDSKPSVFQDSKPKTSDATKNVIPTISSNSSNSILTEEKKAVSSSKTVLDIPSVSIPEVKPEPIFPSDHKIVEISEKSDFSKDYDAIDRDKEEEAFGDVVSAVNDLVRQNSELQQTVNKQNSTILSLQDKLRTMNNQQDRISELQKENTYLRTSNSQLQHKVNQLEEGYRQVRDALSSPSSYGEREYQKVA